MQAKTKDLKLLVGDRGTIREPKYPSTWGISPEVVLPKGSSREYINGIRSMIGPSVETTEKGRTVLAPFNFQTRF